MDRAIQTTRENPKDTNFIDKSASGQKLANAPFDRSQSTPGPTLPGDVLTNKVVLISGMLPERIVAFWKGPVTITVV